MRMRRLFAPLLATMALILAASAQADQRFITIGTATENGPASKRQDVPLRCWTATSNAPSASATRAPRASTARTDTLVEGAARISDLSEKTRRAGADGAATMVSPGSTVAPSTT